MYNKNMITLKEIASRCSVSIATVSNILNGKSNVSEETKQRVLDVVKETGYRPNYMARTLRARKTNTIGLILDDLTGFSSPMIVNGVMAYCEEKKYKTVIENLRFYSKWESDWYTRTGYKEAVDAAIQEMLAIKVDGIVYIAAHAHKIDSIPTDLPVPVVITYASGDYSNIPCIMLDDINSGYEMTKHLIEKGNKKIAVVTGLSDSSHTKDRLEGYKKALAENNLPYDESIIMNGDWGRDSGYNCCKDLLAKSKDCDAIFCFNDVMAAGVYDYLRESNLVPGKDINVAGFDNRDFAEFMTPPLTTMAIKLYDMGRQSAMTILDMINGSTLDEGQLKQYIPCSLVERKSILQK